MCNDDEICELLILAFSAILSYIILVDLLLPDRIWTKEINDEKERALHGFFNRIFEVTKQRDEAEFRKITRMGVPQFELLLNLLKERLTKTSNRQPIDAECRLALTLLYLSQGSSRQVLAWAFRIGASTVQAIVVETCEHIWDELHHIYLSFPDEAELLKIAAQFYEISGMPNCIGAIDGKHINIVCPPNAGSQYYNYKGHHSIVLLACCDANYCFTYVDIGAFGSESDGGVFSRSTFGRHILGGALPLPEDRILPNSDIAFPFFFVADAAFPLKKNLMRPYPGRNLKKDKECFNYKLSSARRFIENTFGIMCARWRILLNTLHCHPKNVDKIVKAVVVLHNFVKLNDQAYCPPNYVDRYEGDTLVDGLWRNEVESLQQYRPGGRYNARREAFTLRDTLKDYLFQRRSI